LTVWRPASALAAVAAAAVMLFSPPPARAECPYIPPWPALTEFGRSAREIIVGTVVDGGGSSFLELRVDLVLRGEASVGEVRKLDNLLPNWPREAGPSCTYLIADEGDVIALGFGALAPDGRTRINAVAWIEGSPDHYHHEGGDAEVATLAEIEAIAGLPATSTAASGAGSAAARANPVLIALIAVGASLVALRQRLARQR
jgi:hypothetical protein